MDGFEPCKRRRGSAKPGPPTIALPVMAFLGVAPACVTSTVPALVYALGRPLCGTTSRPRRDRAPRPRHPGSISPTSIARAHGLGGRLADLHGLGGIARHALATVAYPNPTCPSALPWSAALGHFSASAESWGTATHQYNTGPAEPWLPPSLFCPAFQAGRSAIIPASVLLRVARSDAAKTNASCSAIALRSNKVTCSSDGRDEFSNSWSSGRKSSPLCSRRAGHVLRRRMSRHRRHQGENNKKRDSTGVHGGFSCYYGRGHTVVPPSNPFSRRAGERRERSDRPLSLGIGGPPGHIRSTLG